MLSPLVISMSAFQAFKRCRKSYQIQYEFGLEPLGSSAAAQLGTEFHAIVHWANDANRGQTRPPQFKDGRPFSESAMLPIAQAYIDARPFVGETLYVEEPIYTQVLGPEVIAVETVDDKGLPTGAHLVETAPVYIRTTFDRIYRHNGWVIGRDYKTFDKAPTLGGEDFNFQGRIYLAVLQQNFGPRVHFEWEHVRRELGRELKGKGYVPWAPEDRYVHVEYHAPAHELSQLWQETQSVARDILRAKIIAEQTYDTSVWYRQDLNGSIHSCQSCFVRDLCLAEMQHTEIDEQTAGLLAKPREYVEETLPFGTVIMEKPR